MENEDCLAHYGVLGMKWGRRKEKSPSSSKKSSSKSSKQYRKSYEKQMKSRKKNLYKDIAKLSDNELRIRINRMQLERQYSSLLKDQSYAVKRGKNKTDGILKQEVKQVVRKQVKKALNPTPIKSKQKGGK